MIIKNNKTVSSVIKGNQTIAKIIKAGQTIYENFKNILLSGIPPLTLPKCKGVPLLDYKIYGESVQDGTPTPEIPIEIESVGEKTKNVYSNGDMIFTKQRSITLSNTIKAGTYTISALFDNDSDIYNTGLIFYGTATTIFGNLSYKKGERISKTATFNEDITRLVFYATDKGSTNDGVNASFTDIQIEEGTIATEYEPYGYKIPVKVTPTIYEFKPENISIYPYTNTTNRCGWDLGVLEAGEYTIDLDLVEEGVYPDYLYIRYINAEGKFSSAIYVTAQHDFTPRTFTADGASHYYLYFAGNGGAIELSKTEWQKVKSAYLQKGTAIESITTNIYINEPLRSLPNGVRDKIYYSNDKMYNEQKVTSEYLGTGFTKYGSLNVYFKAFETLAANTYSNLSSNYFKAKYADVASLENGTMTAYGEKFVYFRNDSTTTIEEFEEWAKDVYIQYELAEPIVTEITNGLPNIPTFKGTTIIEVDTSILPSNMEVTYKGKEV